MKGLVLTIDEFQKLSFRFRKGLIVKNDEIQYDCLLLMYVLNRLRGESGISENIEKTISEIADFLDFYFNTDFNFKYGFSNRCPYGDQCDMSCGPSQYENCSADTLSAHLHKTKQQVEKAINGECRKRNIVFED